MSIGIGDEVLFSKYGGTDIEVDGKDVKMMERVYTKN